MIGIDTLIQVTAFGAFLWLALYILSRANRRDPQTIITFLALCSVAFFFFYTAYISTSYHAINLAIVRGFWWNNVFPVTVWLHISNQMARGLARPLLTPGILLNYSVAGAITLLGTFTDLFIDYSHVQLAVPSGQVSFGPGPLYWTYSVYVAVALLAALWNVRRSRRRLPSQNPARSGRDVIRMHQFLGLGGGLFLLGALYLTLRQQTGWDGVQWPGILILLGGLALVAYNVARYEMMVSGQNVRRDFAYSVTGVIVVNILYAGFLTPVGGINSRSLFVLVGLATTTFTLYDLGLQLLDRLFFSQAEQQARADARAYAVALASTPLTTVETPPPEAESLDPEDEKNFNNIVRRSITNLKNPTQLVKSPLLSLRLIERRLKEAELEDNRLNRAAVLREVLVEYIERLRPAGISNGAYNNYSSNGSSEPGTGDAWRFYNVLYLPYVREISRKSALGEARRLELERKRSGQTQPSELEQLLNWLTDIDEATFYKWQRRASDTIAELLRESENRQPVETKLSNV